MLVTNNKYTISIIDTCTVYITPNFEMCGINDVISDILKDIDSYAIKYIIYNGDKNGVVIFEKGNSYFYTNKDKKIKPFSVDTEEFIADGLIRRNLVKLRKESKMSRKELCEMTGLSQQCISNLESESPKQTPNLSSMLKYLNCLGYDLQFIPKDKNDD